MAGNNLLNYTNYDFDELVKNLIDRLKTSDAWKDTYISSTGYTIIEQFAYVANMLLYALERRTEECYIKTAQNRSSIINLVSLLNYSPKRAVSATGKVQFSIDTAVLGKIWIPKYSIIKSAADVQFVTASETVIDAGSSTSAEVDVIQGTPRALTVVSTGVANLEVNIESTVIENDTHTSIPSLFVYVDGRLWTKTTSFLDAGATTEEYLLRHELDDTVTIIFGDNVRGKIPIAGASVTINYIDSDGLSGNIYETDKVTNFPSSSIEYSYLVDGVTLYGDADVSVTNTTQIIGGDDAESTEEIRVEAPNVFKTGDRLVTKLDFEAFLYNYPSIAEVNVWGENEESPPNYNMFNTVRICLLIEGWQLPTVDVKNLLSEALYDKSMLTVKYEFIEAEIFNVVVALEVVVYTQYGLSATSATIEDTLEASFVLGTTATLGEPKRISNLIDAVDSLAAVKYHHMDLEIRETLSDSYASGFWGGVLISDTILPETCNVYIGSDIIATDVQSQLDETEGTFTDSSSGYTVSGTIDYDSKEVLLAISPEPETTPYVRYQQDYDRDVLVPNNGICKLYEVDVQTIEYAT